VCGCPLIGTLADAFAYASAAGVTLRIDGTEVQVRRPRANKPGRRAFVSGKKKMNTKKATVITDEKGRTLWAGRGPEGLKEGLIRHRPKAFRSVHHPVP
jgi:hypothetical protein